MKETKAYADYRAVDVKELLADAKFANYGGLKNMTFLAKCIDRSSAYFSFTRKNGRMSMRDLEKICKICKLNPQDYIVDTQVVEIKPKEEPKEEPEDELVIAHIGDVMKKLNELERKLDEIKEMWK